MRKQPLGLWLLILAVLGGLFFLGSCAKKENESANSKPTQDKSAKPAIPTTSSADMIPLPTQLPLRQFVGTPVNLDGIPHLEPRTETARPLFLVPKDVTNVALNKPVTTSSDEPIMGELSFITDGEKEAGEDYVVELDINKVHVTVDLEAEHEIYAILFWHYHKQQRVYYDVIVQLSNDPDFVEGVTTLFNNDIDGSTGLSQGEDMHYVESNAGKLVDAKGVRGRYVRLYSNGSNVSEVNHYLEIEVFGRPVP